MENRAVVARGRAKSPQQHFLRVLERDFQFAPRVAQAILEEARACLVEPAAHLKGGQKWVQLAERSAGHGQAMDKTATKNVYWTVDAEGEDKAVKEEGGKTALRRVRIQRLLSEALEQDALATQEDLARVLGVSVRTVKRDFKALQGQGVELPSRGNVLGVGRGQTHKSQIVGRWLAGETYDQISMRTHHTVASVRRYVQAFVRVVTLATESYSVSQIALVTQCSQPLVKEYLALYERTNDPVSRQRLREQLARLQSLAPEKQGSKKGVL